MDKREQILIDGLVELAESHWPDDRSMKYARSILKEYREVEQLEMKWHKSYFIQCEECEKNGNRFEVRQPFTFGGLVACVKYKTRCDRTVCRLKRIQEGE